MIKKRTQKGLILATMWDAKTTDFNDWFHVSDFCGGSTNCPFIGYKAAARIGEMQKKGWLVSIWSENKTELGKRLKKYRVSDSIEVVDSGDYLEIIHNLARNTLDESTDTV